MVSKRLVGVITVKDGWAVQSFGYRRYLPLGHPERLAENLDRWGADEILVSCIDRSRANLGPDLDLLGRLGALGLSTPLSYAGGVRTAEDAGLAIQHGAERVCIDAALHSDPERIREMAALVGAQALIAALPLSVEAGTLARLDYRSGESGALGRADLALLEEGIISEALVIDWRNEGTPNSFDMEIVRLFPSERVPLIAFGGISQASQVGTLLDSPRVIAVAVGNFLNYREHAVQALKKQVADASLRPPSFMIDYRDRHMP